MTTYLVVGGRGWPKGRGKCLRSTLSHSLWCLDRDGVGEVLYDDRIEGKRILYADVGGEWLRNMSSRVVMAKAGGDDSEWG